MAKKPTFRELYERGQAEPQTPYQRRIANASDRGLTTAQGRGHARTTKGEQPITALKRTNKLPKIKRRDRYTKVVNHRWITFEFANESDISEMVELLHQQAVSGNVTFQMATNGIQGPRSSNIHRFYLDDFEDEDTVHDELSDILETLADQSPVIGESRSVEIRVRRSFND